MTQHTPARYPSHRTVPQGWSDDIGLSAAFSLLLVVPAVIVAGILGAVVAVLVGPVLGYLANRMFATPATVAVATSCPTCGDLTLAASGHCPRCR
ncbi:MAG: hypothetical protein AAGA90_19375 [Actinomycetota bacterium]